MAFDLDSIGGFSTDTSTTVTMPGGAAVDRAFNVAFDTGSETGSGTTNTIFTNRCWVKLGNNAAQENTDASSSDFNLNVGDQLFIHNVALKNTSTSDAAIIAALGNWQFAKVQSVTTHPSSRTFTLDRDVTLDLDNFYVQAVVIQQYQSLTISGVWYGFEYNSAHRLGGVRIVKANYFFLQTSTTGTGIDLRGCGMPASLAAERPLLAHERLGTNDTDYLSGFENSYAPNNFTLNVGDGAFMLITQHLYYSDFIRLEPEPDPEPEDQGKEEANAAVANDTDPPPTIGNLACAGVPYCRGAADSPNVPSGVTNVGGSTIVIVAQDIQDDLHMGSALRVALPKIFGKYRTGTADDGLGKGLGRAYLAVPYIKLSQYGDGTSINSDEGLYALDIFNSVTSNGNAYNYLYSPLNVKYFGHGVKAGNWLIPATMLNHIENRFAQVTSYSKSSRTLTLGNKYETDGLPEFAVGTLVMVHEAFSNDAIYDGDFFLARITAVSGDTITLDYFSGVFADTTTATYTQVITIPEYEGLTVEGTITCPGYTPSYGYGGICAIAVKNTLDLRGGKVDVTGKGTGYDSSALFGRANAYDGNAFMATRLPIGQGHGSVFILANNILMDENTRIGATYSGNAYGGQTKSNTSSYAGGGYHGGGGTRGGYGGGGGTDALANSGGWHGNAPDASSENGGRQGAHIFIVANKITGFNLAAISTGGENAISGQGGGAGYGGGGNPALFNEASGGGGGFQGGGSGASYNGTIYNGCGGSAGACFIYCNEYEYANFDGILTG